MPLQIDYRPKNFDEFFGNRPVVNSLKAIFGRKSDYPHVYLFQGPKGCGKTTLARIVLNKLGADKDSYVEYNCTDAGVKLARTIAEEVEYPPLYGHIRVIFLDEVHMSTPAFQSHMLKSTEECPDHTYYVLGTTNPEKLLATLRSRCHTFDVSNLSRADCIALLNWVLKQEKVDYVSEDVKSKIYEASEGCPREALKILDQVIDMQNDKDMLEAIQNYNADEAQVNELWNALLRGQSWGRMAPILKKMDLSNPEKLRRAMLTVLGNALLQKGEANVNQMLACFEKNLYDSGKPGFISCCYVACMINMK